ncbi:lipase [Grimontia kaedaensis]|uniref:Lipase n=1 Tax=Grimontia kaedaensis TaxID=2872157 RepID=A0ABY4WTD4_9GAMM|nr:VolA/Pla-1 family phospholipase [Grimontia kaedaensis]USH01611.1 lipase [Grimontia kaedaensis]
MYKGLIVNKKLVVLAVSSALGLTACGGEAELSGGTTNNSYEDYIQESLKSPTQIDFQLAGAGSNVPGPSFILMNQTDGTLDIPTGGDNALSNPAAAMGTMDGWPVSMPMVLSFKGAGLADGFATTGISIVKLTEGLTDENPSVERVLQVGVDFNVMTSADSDSAVVIFTQPLEASSEYAFAITNAFTDTNGEAVGMTSSYATLISQTNPTVVDSLKAASAVTQGVNAIFAATGIQPEDIVYSSWFSTQSVGNTLYATKAAIATGAEAGNFNTVWKGSANPNGVDMSQAYLMSVPASGQDYAAAIQADSNFSAFVDPDGTVAPALIGAYAAGTVTVTNGTVKLPYFLEKDASSWNTTPFESGMPSLAVISSALSDTGEASTVTQQLVQAGIDVSKLTDDTSEQLKLIGLTLENSTGSQLDSERVITGYSPVPQVKSLDDVPFILFTPTTTTGAMELVIYQHGITSAKESAYAFAANLINGAKGLGKDIAILAIDQPIHGERSLDATRSANVDPTNYLNLSYLPVGRDNLRQSILDNVGLRAAVSISQGAGLFGSTPLATLDDTTTNSPSLFGHSLGGITGFGTVATANNTLGSADADNLFKYSRIAAANTGGQIVNLLIASGSFGPLIVDTVTAGVSDAEKEGVLNQFAYAAQTVLDTVDPLNLVSLNDATETNVLNGLPIYMQQVKDDDTVPNSVATAPFAGTIPLATILGLNEVTQASTATSGGRNFTKFSNVGHHSSVIAPQDVNLADLSHTTEMQSQLVQFLTGVAEDFTVADSSVLE